MSKVSKMSKRARDNEKGMLQIREERLENAEISKDGLSIPEVAKLLGLTVAEVRKIEKEALRKLKKPTDKNKALHEYWNISLVGQPIEEM